MNGLKNVRNRHDDALSRVRWDEFEVLLADYYRAQGFDVEHVGTGATRTRFDGGIDLKLRRDDEYVIVECKHWNAKQVAHNTVHQLIGVMVNECATGAILVTSGEFTAYAIESATRQGHVQLIDGNQLRAMIGAMPESDRREEFVAAMEKSVTSKFPVAGGRRRGTRQRFAARGSGAKLMLSGLFALVLFALFLFAIQFALRQFHDGPLRQSATATTISAPQRAASTPRSLPDAAKINPVSRPAQPMSEAEFREWQQKNEESMKILEKTTPEIP